MSIEAMTKYFVRIIYKAQTEGYKSFVPRDEAVEDFTQYNDEFHKETVWSTKCRSWLKGGTNDGTVITYPGSRVGSIHVLQYPRYEDFEWRTESPNRFAFLGNGKSAWEEEGYDITWYLDDPEGGMEHIHWGKLKA